MLIGYARVSTREQETYLQIDALNKAGVEVIYQEKTSSVGSRPELQKLLARLSAGDCLVVYKMDRIARSLKDLLSILDRVKTAGASIRSITEPLDTTGPIGLFIVQVLGAVAQLERGIIRERAIAGQVAAIKRGVVWGGRKSSLSSEQAAEALRLRQEGMTQREVADALGVSRSTISRLESPARPRTEPRRPVLSQYLSQEPAE
ncbi:resolvase [Comamonas thiooxydans]|uniref:recombinase family protein n=1 Tax=Comamonas thiooxydans TaxID=363952 RepID=UPI0006229120|nr:recombinase family protein [Comamonas thiooxydans]KKI14500.1 resolvase [Comamonas thiooxydans]